MTQRFLFSLLLLFALALAACESTPEAQIQVLPTLASLQQTPVFALEGAERVARAYLESWTRGDFEAMYALTSFSSQEANPLAAFIELYQSVQTEMTLRSLSYVGMTLTRDSSRVDVAVFNHEVTFTTDMLGEFTDQNRNLRLVVDARAGDWRVAWSPGDIFPEMAEGAQLRLEISPPGRANIYDRDDQILADQNGRVVVVRAVKQEIAAWPTCLGLLAPAMAADPVKVQKVYDDSAADWLMELGTMEAAAYEQAHVQLEQVCAAQFTSRPTRRYINGTIAPHILGSVGYPDEVELPAVEAAGFNADSIIGKSGIEQGWDERLRGRPGGRLLIVTQGGGILREVARATSSPAESVWLTLDSNLQAQMRKILSDAYAAARDGWGSASKGAAAIVLNVNTGEILAMLSYPSYDANAFAPFPTMGKADAARMVEELQTDATRPLLNRAAQGLYPLGSVFKTISAVAVADTGVYALDERFTCSGVWAREDNFRRFDWLPGGHGLLTLPGAITQSCNPYFYEVGYQINQYDPFALPSYARRLGMGAPTGLQDIAEASGLIIDPDWKLTFKGEAWTFSDSVNMAIGQGEVQVTPLQVVRMFAAFANGGTLYRPQLVRQVGILGEAPSFVNSPDPLADINIRPEVLDTLREGLCNVTRARAGTAEYQFRNSPDLQQIGVCGKTGTAQDGSSITAAPHAWFAAYAPMNDPEIAVVVMVENSGEGSEVAAPIARDILLYYFFGR